MLHHYLLTSWRSLKRNKFFSFINIFGLALGMSACLLILQYVSYELSYEDFQVNGDRIYRVEQDRFNNEKLSTQWAAGAYAVGSHFKKEVPQIASYVSLSQLDHAIAYKEQQPLKIENAYFASEDFFKIFTIPLIAGNAASALTQPNTVAISATVAQKLFGTINVTGRYLALNQNSKYLITAVYRDPPANTQLRPNLLVSYATFIAKQTNNPEDAWQTDGCLTYLLLQKGAVAANVEQQLVPIVHKYMDQRNKASQSTVVYHLQPLKDIHLHSHYLMEPGPVQQANMIYLLFGVAIFIVVIAWVNYVNLTTAKAATRAKEIGIRKSIGSFRRQLIGQFLLEAGIFNLLALLASIMLMLIALPAFNNLTGMQLGFSLLGKSSFWLGVIALFVLGTIAAGIYPALVLSGFNPVKVLKDHSGSNGQNQQLRKSLVTFQFVISMFLLIGTLVVFKQIQFMRQQSLGVDINQTLILQPPQVGLDSSYPLRMATLKNQLLQDPAIKNITISTSIPGQAIEGNAGGTRLIESDSRTENQYRFFFTDYNFMAYYQLKMIAGRSFSSHYPEDVKNNAVIVTKKAVEQLGIPDPHQAIGKRIYFLEDTCLIVGVAADYHQESLQQGYDQIIMRLAPHNDGYVSISLNRQDASKVIEKAKKVWTALMPGNGFDYFFLNDHFNQQYKNDQQFGKIFMIFTSMAIIIGCLGLFGLASFSTLQRRKEIAVRKILGASPLSILKLLYKETLFLLLIAFVITIPIAWLAMTHWLHNFAFPLPVSWLYFLIPFLGISVIAILTTSFHTLKAARQNPVEGLQTQ